MSDLAKQLQAVNYQLNNAVARNSQYHPGPIRVPLASDEEVAAYRAQYNAIAQAMREQEVLAKKREESKILSERGSQKAIADAEERARNAPIDSSGAQLSSTLYAPAYGYKGGPQPNEVPIIPKNSHMTPGTGENTSSVEDMQKKDFINHILNQGLQQSLLPDYLATNNPESRIAPLEPEHHRSREMANQTGQHLRYLQAALMNNEQAATPFQGRQIEAYMNPYQKHVVDKIAELGNRNLAENILPALEARFISAGQFGSSRHADFSKRAARDIQAEISAAQQKALHQGYGQAADIHGTDRERMGQTASRMAALGQTAQAQHMNDVNALNATGDFNQGVGQEIINARHNEQIRRAAVPFERNANLASLVSGVPSGHMVQTYARGNDPAWRSGHYAGALGRPAVNTLTNMFFPAQGQPQQRARGGQIKAIGRALSKYQR